MAVLLAEILLSLFAVFGLYAAVRFFCFYHFSPPELGAAVTVTRTLSEEEVVWLLASAKEYSCFLPHRRVTVYVSRSVADADALQALFLRHGAQCFIF